MGVIVLAFSSCGGYDDSALIGFPFTQVGDVSLKDVTQKMELLDIASPVSQVVFLDSVVIYHNFRNSQFLFEVSDSRTDSLIGFFCRRGRAENEFIEALPKMDIVRAGDSLKGWFHQYYDKYRFILWDISESLKKGMTIYDRIVPVAKDEKDGSPLVAFSYHWLPEDKMFVYNSRQNARKDWMVEPPTYELYDLSTNTREQVYHPFNLYVEDDQGDNASIRSKTFLSLTDCIKPSRDKVAFGMYFIPYLGVIDPRTGETKGIRMKGYPGLNLKEKYYHFYDIQADDNYIYALYAGTPADRIGEDTSAKIMVFTWDCELVAELKVGSISGISLDGDKMYLFNHKYSKYYRINIEDLAIPL